MCEETNAVDRKSWHVQAWDRLVVLAKRLRDARRRGRTTEYEPSPWLVPQMDATRVQQIREKMGEKEIVVPASPKNGLDVQLHWKTYAERKKKRFVMEEIKPVQCVFINIALFMLLLYVKP